MPVAAIARVRRLLRAAFRGERRERQGITEQGASIRAP